MTRRFFKDDKGSLGKQFINRIYYLFSIVKGFTFKMLWTASCFGFLFLMPCLFEIINEQELVLEKIQRDDMIAQAADLSGYSPDMQGEQPIVRPF